MVKVPVFARKELNNYFKKIFFAGLLLQTGILFFILAFCYDDKTSTLIIYYEKSPDDSPCYQPRSSILLQRDHALRSRTRKSEMRQVRPLVLQLFQVRELWFWRHILQSTCL